MSDFDFASEYEAFGDELKGVAYEGDYDMVVQKAVPGTTKGGKQQFLLTLGFANGPYKTKNKTIIDRLIWSPESDVAAKIFSGNLKCLGATHEWIMANRPTPAQIADRITGAVFAARLRPDEWNNQAITRVNYLNPIKVKSGDNAGAATATATGAKAKAVSLDDAVADAPATEPDETGVDTATGEVKEPVNAGAGASDNPWG